MISNHHSFLDAWFSPSAICSKVWYAIFGKSTSYSCQADKDLEWKWNFNGGPLPINVVHKKDAYSSKSVLRINGIQQNNSGTYECRGYDKGNLVVAKTCDLEVTGKLNLTNS